MLQTLRSYLANKRRRYLRRLTFWRAKGIIHIGANAGQERRRYGKLGVPVVWVEAIPAVYETLQKNIAEYPHQVALNALVTDTDGESHRFNISGNGGLSSSIYELGGITNVWPQLAYVDQVELTSVTLPTLLRDNDISPAGYDLLVLDTQGSELSILQGAAPLLSGFRFILAEVASADAYESAPLRADVTAYLEEHGFAEWIEFPFPDGGGSYFDVLYRRVG